MKAITKYITGIIAGLVIISGSSYGQDRITGFVYDENKNPIPAANVTIVGSALGTFTNQDGSYSISGISGALCDRLLTVQVNFIGYFGTSVQYYENCDGGTQTVNIFLVSDRAPLLVTNTDDSGPGSLRQAILDANANLGKDYIHFDVPDIWVASIVLLSELPQITEDLMINGFSQPGSEMNSNPAGTGLNTRLKVELNGSTTGVLVGLRITSGQCTIMGVIINRCHWQGLVVNSDGNQINDCFIGTDTLGISSSGYGNGNHGIMFNNSSDNFIQRCVISGNGGGGNGGTGIQFQSGSNSNRIYGNIIGADIEGLNPLPNISADLQIYNSSNNTIGGISDDLRNLIVRGLHITGPESAENEVINNYFGTKINGSIRMGSNRGIIIEAGATLNTIGPRNLISGIASTGVIINGPETSGNKIIGNFIGTDAEGNDSIDNVVDITIQNYANNNIVGGNSADSMNVFNSLMILSGATNNSVKGNYIGITASGTSTLPGEVNKNGIAILGSTNNIIGPGNAIGGRNFGVYIAPQQEPFNHCTDNKIIGNRIGTNPNGTLPLGNITGIEIRNAESTIIGGLAESERNIISGNSSGGIRISENATGTQVINNYIGTDATGTLILGNASDGVRIYTGAHENTIGPDNLISGNSGHGISIYSEGSDYANNNVIHDNYIGTNSNGTTNQGNGIHGIDVRGNASGTKIGPGNTVVSNTYDGIHIETSGTGGTSIFGNLVGTNSDNSIELGNGAMGIVLNDYVSNTTIGSGNVISGNGEYGIHIHGGSTDNTIVGNFIGTTTDGASDLGNHSVGIFVSAPGNRIGGTGLFDKNVISGNDADGIVLFDLVASGNEIYGNYIGTDSTGTISVKNGSVAIGINNAPDNIIGGLNPGEGNIISDIGIGNSGATGNHVIGNYIGINANGDQALDPGKGNAGVGIIDASDNVVGPGNIISGNQEGIFITSSDYGSYPDRTARTKVFGNMIGTNAEGNDAIPNQQGILVEGALETIIGGVMDGERNLISGNLYEGIAIRSQNQQTRVLNNYIGSDLTGKYAIPNDMGIKINDPSTETYIGAGVNGIGNLIAFNTGAAIGVDAHQNFIQGNVIHGNSGNGIYITGNQNTIGGPNEADRNYIYGNDGGISNFYNSNENLIQGNVLGTDSEGIEDKTDSWDGIAISGNDNIVRDNLISGYQNQAILITRWSPDEHIPQRNRIEQNRIGLALNGGGFIPNGHGISLNTTTDNVIIGNEVAGNMYNGIALRDDFGAVSINNLISQNLVYSNGGIGIDLISDGPTPNDVPPDIDEGPNHLQNFPVLESINFGEGNVTVSGVLRSEASSTYNLEFFSSGIGDPSTYGEGQFYLGSEQVQTDGNGEAFFECTVPTAGYGAQVITATATDPEGNTSEFSQVIGGVINQVLAEMPFIYTLNSEGLPTVPLADYQNAIQSSFQTWDNISTAEIQMEDGGSSDEKYASATDGLNLISFQDDHFLFSKGVLAVTAKTLRISAGGSEAEILDADIVFNPAYISDPFHPFAVLEEGDNDTMSFDIQTVATHEIGHILGMIHSGVPSARMFFMLGYGGTGRDLGLDDIAWASYRYPSETFLLNHGLISGRITYGDLGDTEDPSSHPPVAGALVLSVDMEYHPVTHAYTDADGNYTIPIPLQGGASDEYYIYIQPLDGNVFETALRPANISPYIYSHTIYTDFPNEFYDAQESYNDPPGSLKPIQVSAGGNVSGIDLITNADLTAPEVIGVSPDEGETGVGVSPTLVMKFSEPVDIHSFDETTCFLELSGETIQGEFTILADSTHIMLMKPVEALQYETSYTLHIANITDLKGNELEALYTSSFTTQERDTDPPYVYDVIPADASTQVDITKPIKLFFSEPMNKSSVVSAFTMMTTENMTVDGDISWDVANKKLTYTPDYSLDEGTDYIIGISTAATDLSGNNMENDFSVTFSTVDVAAPQILYLGPADGSTGITVETPVVVKVSEPLEVSTITSSSFTLSGLAGQVNGTYEYLDDDRTIIFRPDQALQFDQSYTITLSSDISDISNPKQYLQATTATFQTAPGTLVPHILYMEPPFGAVGAKTTIVGSGFDPVKGNNLVWFDGVPAIVTKSTLESVTVLVPVGAESGPVTVSINGVAADNSFEFDVVPLNTDPSYSVIAGASSGSNTRAVVINPDAAYAYVTNWGDNTVTPLDLSGNIPVPGDDIPVGAEPMDIDLNSEGTLAYVSNFLSNTVSVIGTDQEGDFYHQVKNNIKVGYHPYGVAVSSDKKVYVANNESEYVSVIDVDPSSGGFDHVIANLKTGSNNRNVVVTADAVLVLVTGDNGVAIIDRDPGSPTFNDVVARASAGSSTRDVTITADAALALATTEDGVILIIDIYQPPSTQFGNVIASVKTGSSARNITISTDAAYVYLTNPDDNTVSVYQLDYSIVPGFGASLNNPLGLVHLATIEVDENPYAIVGHPNSEYILVTHDSDEGGVTKIGIEGLSIDPIQSLIELIASVEEAKQDGTISRLLGSVLLYNLNQTLNRVNLDMPGAAILSLDKFIRKVERNISYGRIPEDLGNAWLDAAYRIRDQLVKDFNEKFDLKSSQAEGSGINSVTESNDISNRSLSRIQTLRLENRPNPFNDHTQVFYEIPDKGQAEVPVVMRVFNINGQVMKTLVHQDMKPGRYMLDWNIDMDDGGQVPDGIYLLELRTPDERQAIRLSVVR